MEHKPNQLTYQGKIYNPQTRKVGDKTLTEFAMMKSKKDKDGNWQNGFINFKHWGDFPYQAKQEVLVTAYLDVEAWKKDGKPVVKIIFTVTSIKAIGEAVEYKTPDGGTVSEEDLPF